jgi:hypothetical protein
MFRSEAPAIARRPGRIALGLIVALLSASVTQAQAAPAPQAQAVSPARTFPAEGAMWLHFIKADKAADFEMVIAKLKEALAKSEKPERKQQAEGWKFYRSPEPAGANVLFVMIIDPVLKGADYQISNIIQESFPAAEATDILKKYAESYANPAMNIANLNQLK